MFATRRRKRQAKEAHRADVTATVLHARSVCIDAMHEAGDEPHVVSSLVEACGHYDLALEILADRIPDHPELCDAIASKPNVF
jgi:hypothetical protein